MTKWQPLLVMGAVLTGLMAAPAAALVQPGPPTQASASTPKGWAYELRDGKRVPRGNRTTNPDGSWREEVRQGTCTTVKEKTANGDYSETRKCD